MLDAGRRVPCIGFCLYLALHYLALPCLAWPWIRGSNKEATRGKQNSSQPAELPSITHHAPVVRLPLKSQLINRLAVKHTFDPNACTFPGSQTPTQSISPIVP
ncbi:hypothetical protein J3F83DRAFT_721645 [Trichoderma novae-zelandiae]